MGKMQLMTPQVEKPNKYKQKKIKEPKHSFGNNSEALKPQSGLQYKPRQIGEWAYIGKNFLCLLLHPLNVASVKLKELLEHFHFQQGPYL